MILALVGGVAGPSLHPAIGDDLFPREHPGMTNAVRRFLQEARGPINSFSIDNSKANRPLYPFARSGGQRPAGH
jgi:hypothetical protein